MGLLRSIAGGLVNMASRGRNSTMLGMIFQEDQRYAGLARPIFERCLAERGLKLTDLILDHAVDELNKYPTLTMGEFLDGIDERSAVYLLSRRG